MKSLSCIGDGRVALVEVPDPEPRSGDVLVRIEASAVCGSERGALINGFTGNIGHEACGTVIDAGASGVAVGDRVGLAAIAGCGECDQCAGGEELHCRRGPRFAIGGGWHAELATVSPACLRQLPPGATPAAAVLLSGDALGVPARSLRRVPSGPGERVLIIGLGPIGLGHLAVRSFAGAEVTAIEPSAYRRDLGRRLGASTVLSPGDDVEQRPRVVIECTGRPDCIAQALAVVDNKGVVLQSGECHEDVPINPSDIFIRREVTYTGSWYYATDDYPFMLELAAAGLPVGDVCTHEVSAGDAQGAITDFLEGRSGKVVLRWDEL